MCGEGDDVLKVLGRTKPIECTAASIKWTSERGFNEAEVEVDTGVAAVLAACRLSCGGGGDGEGGQYLKVVFDEHQ